jgi:regulator of RNase E activity RraA
LPDTYEVTLQKTPISRGLRGRTIIPGRIQAVEAQVPVSCGGVQVRPGDIVGCDDDGVLVVPYEIASQAVGHAIAILLADMRGRRALYQRLGMPMDETVDVETVQRYYETL